MSIRKSKTPAAQAIAPQAIRRHFVGCVEDAIIHLGLTEVKKIVAQHSPKRRRR